MASASDLKADVNEAWESARVLAGAGRHDEAYELLAVFAVDALPPGALSLRERLREQLKARLGAQFPPDAVLQPVVTADMRSFPLRAQDMYVFGLLRNEIALSDILAISPLDEVDSLRVVAKLVSLGLVKQSGAIRPVRVTPG